MKGIIRPTVKEVEVFCEGCGLVDSTHSAHCIKHGRSPHRIKGERKDYNKRVKKFLKEHKAGGNGNPNTRL